MDNFNLLFHEAESEYQNKERDIIEKVIADSKEEFTGYSKEHQSRQTEMKDLNEKKGITFIFSTRDKMVMDHSKRLIKLKDGAIASDEVQGGGK